MAETIWFGDALDDGSIFLTAAREIEIINTRETQQKKLPI